MRGSEQAPYVFLKIQPSAHSLHTSWTLLKIALLGIVMETITGKGEKRHLTHFETFNVVVYGVRAAFFNLFPFTQNEILQKKKKNHRISILLSFFASVYFVALLKGRKK